MSREIGLSPRREFITYSIKALVFISLGILLSYPVITNYIFELGIKEQTLFWAIVICYGLWIVSLILGIWFAYEAWKAYKKFKSQKQE